MKITSDSISLGGKTFSATEVDYNSYDVESGSIDLGSKTYYAHKVYGKEARLPEEYQEVEYIESSGTQYIDLGFVPTNNTGTKITFSTNNTIDSIILGVKNSSDEGGRWALNTASRINLSWNSIGFTTDNIIGLKRVAYFNYKNDRQRIIDGTSYTEIDSPLIVDLNYNACMFGAYWAENTPSLFASAKVYDCEITEGTEITHHIISCYRKSDSVAGMYDIVNEVFYTNGGTGEFIVGPDV